MKDTNRIAKTLLPVNELEEDGELPGSCIDEYVPDIVGSNSIDVSKAIDKFHWNALPEDARATLAEHGFYPKD